MTTPAAFRHGPGPMRSRAFSVVVLRYACQVLLPRAVETAIASDLQKASAPVRPLKLPPLPGPRLVTKNDMLGSVVPVLPPWPGEPPVFARPPCPAPPVPLAAPPVPLAAPPVPVTAPPVPGPPPEAFVLP